MKKILVINSSVSQENNSDSLEMSKLFVNEYQKLHFDDQIIYLDLNEISMSQKTLTRNNIQTFFNQEDSFKFIEQLKSIDKIILNFSMINYSIPAILKNFIDHITIANLSFTYKGSKDGKAIGMLSNIENVQLLATKGGTNTPNGAFTDYVKNIWEFLGAKVTVPIINEMMDMPPYNEQTSLKNIEKVRDDILKAARLF
ncbi:FMN-dependent NADH-azoreductase [Entomoplasma ellychniae]|uniref:FMN dependent NADH:quinone oxidoreductase n=1 Tax=Entomoplasma ellychniae TaxID=2114 RepID=A0A8E2UEA5_9MOLU|nr:FMN-dependent NADH-azoreductase [Entomoplasma ellychniae]PPE04893.1 FMN-dependent NADH-azoreductase [Entomoplasma ellychniae]